MSFSDLKKCHYVEKEDLWITPRGRLTFVALARKFKSKKSTRKDDEGQYAIGLVVPPDCSLKPLKKAVFDVAAGKWKGCDIFSNIKAKNKGVKSPFKDAVEVLENGLVDNDGDEVDLTGWTVLRANAFRSRPVVRLANGEEVDVDELEVEAYSGRWARAMVRPASYENESNGVKFWLEGVQLLKHDAKLETGGRTDGTAFGAVEDEDEDDPLA